MLRNCIAPCIVSDGDGGVIIVGESFTVNPVLYAQRVDRYGNIVWDPSLRGIRVTTAGDEQAGTLVVSDGAGGAYLGFNALTIVGYGGEPPEPIYSSFVRIQRFDSQGRQLFGPEGITVYDYPVDTLEGRQDIYALVPNDSAGVYVVCGDAHGPEGLNVYVNYVRRDGQIAWESSIALNPATRSFIQKDFIVYSDGESGLNIYYLPGTSSLPHRFRRIDKNGHVTVDKFIDTGLTVFYLFSDLRGECIFFWQDFNQFNRLDTIRCQKIDRNGEKLWGEKPLIVDSAGQLSIPLGIGKLPDATGGAFFAYHSRNTTRLVSLDGHGIVRFNKAVGSFDGMAWSLQPCMTLTQKRGILYGTTYSYGGGKSVHAMDSTGQELWPAVIYTTREAYTDWNGMVSDGNDGAIVVWFEILPLRGIWAQQVNARGRLGEITNVKDPADQKFLPRMFQLFPAYPNPFGGAVRMAYQMAEEGVARLSYWEVPLTAPKGKHPSFSLGGTQAKYVFMSGRAAPFEVKLSSATFSKVNMLAGNMVQRAVGLVEPVSGAWLNLRVENFLVQHADGSFSAVDFAAAPADTAKLTASEAWAALASADFILPADAESLLVVYAIAGEKATSLSDGKAPLALTFKVETIGDAALTKTSQTLALSSDQAFNQAGVLPGVSTGGLRKDSRVILRVYPSHQKAMQRWWRARGMFMISATARRARHRNRWRRAQGRCRRVWCWSKTSPIPSIRRRRFTTLCRQPAPCGSRFTTSPAGW
ncbi:MAG: hypothetical protein ONB48_01645 [candidate division KSB1 bacterium]|nr:hypothetical protein [candidate division KSB1 bacterium]MDZ7272618.1 hypothetical protein [candidate division KSB1 bacterium]MDZ7284359.1 hypothetical protein [candidate division KSB1 bacterium]MDZ7297245.1 hypothetical protein [candidate division KSB1 bacterium]MDZ7308312.1 hypothetical protein [candidate division KSB1 bacterium]